MGKIYCIMGKSSSGKDTIYKKLVEDPKLSLKRIVPYTTRPMRAGESDGIEYYFCSEETLQELSAAGDGAAVRDDFDYRYGCGTGKGGDRGDSAH